MCKDARCAVLGCHNKSALCSCTDSWHSAVTCALLSTKAAVSKSTIHGVGTAELLEGVFEDIERLEGAGKQGVQVEERDKEVEDFLMDYGIGGDDAKGDDDGFNQLSKREQRKVARMKDR